MCPKHVEARGQRGEWWSEGGGAFAFVLFETMFLVGQSETHPAGLGWQAREHTPALLP